jgi:23S rRNA pseudouridine1911/1915/1917 synthase
MPNPPRDIEIIAEDIPLNVVYEDDDVILINKEAGLVVHPGYGNYTGTLVNALTYRFLGKKTKTGEEMKPYLVHRIDKNTSGIIIVAKNEWAQIHLAKQFFNHSIERNYFGGHNFKDGKSCGIHIEPGPDGGLVMLDDTQILDIALRILDESKS